MPFSSVRDRRVRQVISCLVLAASVIIFLTAAWFESIAVIGFRLRLDRELVLVLGGVITLLAVLCWKIPARMGLMLAVTTWMITLILLIGNHSPRRGERVVSLRGVLDSAIPSASSDQHQAVKKSTNEKMYVDKDEWIENYCRADPVLGMAAIPLVHAREKRRDFDVTYTFDANGYRTIPVPPNPSYRIAFVGCSFTFGTGVKDDECYPAVLARDAWKDCQVQNGALPGWGTTNAAMMAEHMISSDPPPQLVIYGWINHLSRNYLRSSWHQRSGSHSFPFFDFVGDKLEYLGLKTEKDAIAADNAETDAHEVKVTWALLESMRKRCESAGIVFATLILTNGGNDPIPEMLKADDHFHVIDLTTVPFDALGEDKHPCWRWHQNVARALASDPKLAEWTGRKELLCPDAIPSLPRTWAISVNNSNGATADLRNPANQHRGSADTPLLVHHMKVSESKNPYEIVLFRSGIEIRHGNTYKLRFRARAEADRTVGVCVTQDHAPWENLGLMQNIAVGQKWKEFTFSFAAKNSESLARIALLLGSGSDNFELDEVILQNDDHDLLKASSEQ